jgi:hypothetical protein
MKKKPMQDVIPPNSKRSIRDIPLPGSEKKQKQTAPPTATRKVADERPPEPVEPPTPPKPPAENFDDFTFEEKPKGKKKWIIVVLIILLIGIGWFINRSKAEVLVFPKVENTFVQDTFEIADKNSEEVGDKLGYKLLTLEKEASTLVKPSGEEEVSQKASGMIRIFNDYSENGQKLVQRTRFESEDGLVYRIAESITVPGYTDDGPGEIEVEVFADEAGEKYNIENTEFTIPGFKGLPQFDSMYAESVSDMTGGFVGIRKVVSEEDKSAALDSLKEEAKK